MQRAVRLMYCTCALLQQLPKRYTVGQKLPVVAWSIGAQEVSVEERRGCERASVCSTASVRPPTAGRILLVTPNYYYHLFRTPCPMALLPAMALKYLARLGIRGQFPCVLVPCNGGHQLLSQKIN